MGGRPSAKAVRYRRRLLAGLIDRVAKRGGPSVLAIAAGHLREVELSCAVQSGSLKEFVAFDQDEASLAVVAATTHVSGWRRSPARSGSAEDLLPG
jgi:hypothetical protein